MKTIYILSLLTFILFFTNCHKQIDLNLPEEAQKIVVNGVLAADSTLKLNISKTLSTNDTSGALPRITNAKVKLYKNGNYIEALISKGNGLYISSSIINENEKYSLVIEADGKTVTADIDVPLKTNFTELNYISYDDQDNYFKLNLKINDPIGDDYYILDAYINLPRIFFGDTGQVDSIELYKESANFSAFNDNDPYFQNYVYFPPFLYSSYIFNDKLFDNKMLDLSFKLDNFYYVDTSVMHIDSLTIYFKLIKIDANFFNYFISFNKYQNSNGNPFIEPVNVFSNIDGGIGVIGAMAAVIDSLKIPYKEY